MQFGHPVCLWSLTAYNHHNIPIKRPICVGGLHGGLVGKNGGGCADMLPVCGNGGNFDDRLAKITIQHLQATTWCMRISDWAQDGRIKGCCACGLPVQPVIGKPWLGGMITQILAKYGAGAAIQKPVFQQFVNDIANAASRMEMIHIGRTIGVDAGQQGRDFGKIGKILPSQADAGGSGHRRQM